jgi:2-C-methyl-D-erythritol 4-phosphate cytidylyltransferase
MESVFAGINEVSRDVELIAVHDGARPLVSEQVIREVIVRGAECGAAAPAVGLKDTVKRAKNGFVQETLVRENLVAVQTPQVFEASLIRGAILKALRDKAELTDDCAAVERMGMKVALTEGSEENIKITTPSDLLLAEAILDRRENP